MDPAGYNNCILKGRFLTQSSTQRIETVVTDLKWAGSNCYPFKVGPNGKHDVFMSDGVTGWLGKGF